MTDILRGEIQNRLDETSFNYSDSDSDNVGNGHNGQQQRHPTSPKYREKEKDRPIEYSSKDTAKGGKSKRDNSKVKKTMKAKKKKKKKKGIDLTTTPLSTAEELASVPPPDDVTTTRSPPSVARMTDVVLSPHHLALPGCATTTTTPSSPPTAAASDTQQQQQQEHLLQQINHSPTSPFRPKKSPRGTSVGSNNNNDDVKITSLSTLPTTAQYQSSYVQEQPPLYATTGPTAPNVGNTITNKLPPDIVTPLINNNNSNSNCNTTSAMTTTTRLQRHQKTSPPGKRQWHSTFDMTTTSTPHQHHQHGQNVDDEEGENDDNVDDNNNDDEEQQQGYGTISSESTLPLIHQQNNNTTSSQSHNHDNDGTPQHCCYCCCQSSLSLRSYLIHRINIPIVLVTACAAIIAMLILYASRLPDLVLHHDYTAGGSVAGTTTTASNNDSGGIGTTGTTTTTTTSASSNSNKNNEEENKSKSGAGFVIAPPYKIINRSDYNDGIWNTILNVNLFDNTLLLVTPSPPLRPTMTLNTTINGGTKNDIQNEKRLARPFPTGAFWTNFVMKKNQQEQNMSPLHRTLDYNEDDLSDLIAPLPYAYKWGASSSLSNNNTKSKIVLQISYPANRRTIRAKVISDAFYPDLALTLLENITERKIISYDSLSVTIRFYSRKEKMNTNDSYYYSNENHEAAANDEKSSNYDGYMESCIIQGSPYVTAVFKNTTPMLKALSSFDHLGCISLSAEKVGLCSTTTDETTGRQEISGVQFLLQQGDGQRWIVFASEPLTFLVVDDSRNVIQGSQPYTGVLRLAIIPPEASLSGSLVRRLMNHAGVYSTGGEVVTEYYDSSNGNKDTASIRFTFQTAGGGHVGNNNAGNAELLMLALPHHAKVLDCSSGSAKLLRGTAFDGTYRCIKGNMTAVVGNSWSYKETLTSITLKNDRTIVSTDMKNVIRKQVSRDINLIPPSARDIYGFGKEIARMAQLAHIAHALGHDTARDSALDTAQRYLLNFFSDDYEDSLVFDSDLGGIVSLNGVKDPMVDFGNGRYNDHHFHYGYILYASAILGHLNASFIDEYGALIDSLANDVVNDTPTNSYFPVARHKSWYAGHSWASGLFAQGNGKSQESTGEAVNCYFGAYLWGLVRSNLKLKNFARLLLAMEIRSARTYWHMLPNNTLYDPSFTKNVMVGNLGGIDVTSTTWFGNKSVYVHLIQFIPITRITEELFPFDFVSYQYPSIKTMYADTEMSWKGYFVCNHAIIDPAKAWEEAIRLESNALDPALSLSQVMYWIGTRPGNLPQFKIRNTTSAACSAYDSCSGLEGNCCPTDGGVYLTCCG